MMASSISTDAKLSTCSLQQTQPRAMKEEIDNQLTLRAKFAPDFQQTQPRGLKKDIVDTAPHVPSAGTRFNHDGESVHHCVSTQPHDNFENKSVDEVRWRSTYKGQVGLQMTNPGMIGAPIPPPEYRHGIRTYYSDKVGDCLAQNTSEFADFITEQKEKHYRSRKYEPLGTHFSRGHTLPEKYTTDPNARFGIQTRGSESVKSLIYCGHGVDPAAEISVDGKYSYVAESDIAQRKDRKYDWSVDPNSFRFGRPAQNADLSASHGVTACLHQHDPTAAARIGSDRPQQVAKVWQHGVGQRRPLSGSLARLGADFVFGARPAGPSISAKEVIHAYDGDALLPDKDLGRSAKLLDPIHNPAPVPDRVGGIPTIRSDLAPPSIRLLSDGTNYGGEAGARALLNPARYTVEGVGEEEFGKTRNRDEMRVILSRAGQMIDEVEFDHACQRAENEGKLSVASYRAAVRALRKEEEDRAKSRLQAELEKKEKPRVAPTISHLATLDADQRVAIAAQRYRR